MVTPLGNLRPLRGLDNNPFLPSRMSAASLKSLPPRLAHETWGKEERGWDGFKKIGIINESKKRGEIKKIANNEEKREGIFKNTNHNHNHGHKLAIWFHKVHTRRAQEQANPFGVGETVEVTLVETGCVDSHNNG